MSLLLPEKDHCPLSESEQRRNLLLFAGCTGLQYFAAPVLYVGVTQASLCDHLGATARVANLPATLYFAMTAAPALIAWLVPYVSCLKRTMVACYGSTALMLAAMSVILVAPVPDSVRLAAVILQGAVSGVAMPAAIALLWEALGRGTHESRRGHALSLAFGCGPLLAVAGSLVSQLLLSGQLAGWRIPGLVYPWSFASLFGLGAPVIGLAAFLASRFVVPVPDEEAVREPFSQIAGLCGGMATAGAAWLLYFLDDSWAGHGFLAVAGLLLVHHFRDILSQRTLLIATAVTVLLYSGNTITSNMNLYTQHVLADDPENFAGYQNSLRFGFKVVAGLALGWVLTRSSPRTGILLTGALFVAAQIWALLATGYWYLVAFGIYGAGELIGVYAPNYLLSASPTSQIRRTMAFATMLMVPAAPTGYLFGSVSDWVVERNLLGPGAASSRAFGFQVSFAVCATLMASGLLIAVLLLPARPSRGRSTTS